MPVSKAQQKAVNKYMKENYDRINLTLPKGMKDRLKGAVAGQSVNAWISQAIEEKLQRENAGA